MFGEEFQIIRKIGQGEFGQLYLAHSPQHASHVVLKSLDPQNAQHEHSMLADINHPNIVRILDTHSSSPASTALVL